MPSHDDLERLVRLHLYRRFLDDGRPPSVAEAAESLGRPEGDVAEAYRRLADGHVIVLEPGGLDVWMANPLSARPTSFRVEVGDRAYWGSCAWDALGIPPMLARDGVVRSECPDCGEPIALEVRDGGLLQDDAVAHFSVPASRWWEDIGYT